MILILDDSLRTSLLSNGKAIAGKKNNAVSINQIFSELSIDGFIESVDSEHQQLWRITNTAPTTDDATADEHKCIVFSQWTSLLDLVEPELNNAGISFVRLDGTTRDRGAND